MLHPGGGNGPTSGPGPQSLVDSNANSVGQQSPQPPISHMIPLPMTVSGGHHPGDSSPEIGAAPPHPGLISSPWLEAWKDKHHSLQLQQAKNEKIDV